MQAGHLRTLNPFKAIAHALRSVITYRRTAAAIGAIWAPVLIVSGILQSMVGAADSSAPRLDTAALVQVASFVVGLIAAGSMAVSWHRFILRDEVSSPARLDAPVWRYIATMVVVALGMLFVAFILNVLTRYLALAIGSLAWLFNIMATLALGVSGFRLLIRLPAIALGRQDFTFRDAWRASEGYFWPVFGTFMLYAAVLLAILLVVIGVYSLIPTPDSLVGSLVLHLVMTPVTLFQILFGASVFTSLYGFFVERRDF